MIRISPDDVWSWMLFLGTEVRLAFSYAGETDVLEVWIGFIFGTEVMLAVG